MLVKEIHLGVKRCDQILIENVKRDYLRIREKSLIESLNYRKKTKNRSQ